MAGAKCEDTRMRIVLTLLVRDEADVVAATLEHHLAAGADMIVATDNGSVDGTTDVLAAYRDAGVLALYHEPAHDYRQAEWVTRMARWAATVYGADWVINCDADEFFWPAGAAQPGPSGLRDALESIEPGRGKVGVTPANLVAHPDDRGGWADTLTVRDVGRRLPVSASLGDKTCHRADPEVLVSQGNHFASSRQLGPLADQRPLEILHVPDRGYEQYRRKIANGGSAMAANASMPPEAGWQWRRDHELLEAGDLHAAYRARQLDAEQVRAGLADGSLVRDVRLRDRLRGLLPYAVVPWALDACLAPSSSRQP